MSASYETLLVETDAEGVCVITFNRPEKRNSMNPQLTREVIDALEEARYDRAVRVVVLTGAGSAFCAGMDLREFFTDLKDEAAEFDKVSRLSQDWRSRMLKHYPKPTIAMINGYCFGGAFAILDGCDLAVAADEAVFGLSEINFGMFPGGAVSKALSNLLRPRDALFYGMTGRTFDGQRAAEIGLVNYSVPKSELVQDVMALARELAGKSPSALRATKDGYRHSINMEWDAAMSYSWALYNTLNAEQNEAWRERGIGGFLKREYRPGLEANASLRDA